MSGAIDVLAAVVELEMSIWMSASCLVATSVVVFGVVALEVELHSPRVHSISSSTCGFPGTAGGSALVWLPLCAAGWAANKPVWVTGDGPLANLGLQKM